VVFSVSSVVFSGLAVGKSHITSNGFCGRL
jgi:hypothetical protein